MVYNINNAVRSWRLPDGRVVDLPAGAVPETKDGDKTYADMKDIRKALNG